MKKEKKKLAAMLVLAIACMGCMMGCKQEKMQAVATVRERPTAITNVSEPDKRGLMSCTYGDEERAFLEYAPENPADITGLIIALHGADMTAEFFEAEVLLEKDAMPKGYVVVYPTGRINPDRPTGRVGWNSGIEKSPVDDSGFIRSLAYYMQDKYGLTREQTFLAGFSNGAFMNMRMAIEGDDCFMGVASVCGMMPKSIWEARLEKANISVLQISGAKDDATPMNLNGSAKYAKDPAIEDVMDYFTDSMKLNKKEEVTLSNTATLTKRYSRKSPYQVWHVIISDGHHGWQKEKISGFNANDVVLDFFESLRGTN